MSPSKAFPAPFTDCRGPSRQRSPKDAPRVSNSQRFRFYPTPRLEPATEISKSPFGVNGRRRFQLEGLSRTCTSHMSAIVIMKGARIPAG